VKTLCRFLFALILMGTSICVFADTVDDPTLRLNSATGTSANYTISGTTFSFQDSLDTDVTFLQQSGVTWTNLLVTSVQTPIGVLSSYSCQALAFYTNCAVTLSGSTVSIFYSGTDLTHQGITDSGTKFRFQAFGFPGSGDQCQTNGADDPNRCWNDNTTFTMQANVAPAPEPSTALFVYSGAFALAAHVRRRLRRRG
jgi:hypothetical protein